MYFRSVLAIIPMLFASVAAACPTPSDMSSGVIVETLESEYRFQMAGNGRVEEIRIDRHWIAGNTTVQRLLYHGLLPVSQTILEYPEGTRILQDETYIYAGQNVSALELRANTTFSVSTEEISGNGRNRVYETTYTLGRSKTRVVAGCQLEVIDIEAIELWSGSEVIYTYLYFPELGFGIETEAEYPGDTVFNEITRIGVGQP